MVTESILTSEIVPAKYNPKKRIEQIGPLLKSIKEHGIIVPLIIDANKNLIDGHRRLESAKKLKLTKVPVIRIDSKIPKDKAYEIVNATSKRLNGSDWIFIHINGGTVPSRVLQHISMIEEVVGEDGLKKLGNLGASYRILNTAYTVRKYCHQLGNEKFLVKIILWLATHSMSWSVRRAMESRVSKETITKAIAMDRPLKPTFK